MYYSLHDDDNLQILGYDLFGGVCIYYKIPLPLKIKNIHYSQECINFEIKIMEKLSNFVLLYHSPNQCQDDSELFNNDLELNLDSIMVNNPFLTFHSW